MPFIFQKERIPPTDTERYWASITHRKLTPKYRLVRRYVRELPETATDPTPERPIRMATSGIPDQFPCGCEGFVNKDETIRFTKHCGLGKKCTFSDDT